MNGIAVLSKDDNLNKVLLNNGFNQAKGRKRIFKEDQYSISSILEQSSGVMWWVGLFNGSIIVYTQNGSYRDMFAYDCDIAWYEDLKDFIESTKSKYLKELLEKDIENNHITNDDGGDIEDFCTVKFKNSSRLMGEILRIVELSKDRKTSVDDLPDYIDNLVIVF